MTRATPKYDADAFRLRMVYGQWFFHLMLNNAPTGQELGPFPWDQTDREAKKLIKAGLVDQDKKDVPTQV